MARSARSCFFIRYSASSLLARTLVDVMLRVAILKVVFSASFSMGLGIKGVGCACGRSWARRPGTVGKCWRRSRLARRLLVCLLYTSDAADDM
eukprot:8965264-Prorocentrum_lima.AAC.1